MKHCQITAQVDLGPEAALPQSPSPYAGRGPYRLFHEEVQRWGWVTDSLVEQIGSPHELLVRLDVFSDAPYDELAERGGEAILAAARAMGSRTPKLLAHASVVPL